MVAVEDLLAHGSRRQIEEIAASLGHEPASEYPDDLASEIMGRLQQKRKGKGKKQSVGANTQSAAGQETELGAEKDLRNADKAADNRAAGMLVAIDSLTMWKIASRQLSDPSLQSLVDESHERLNQFFNNVAVVYEPEAFLAQTPLAQIATGENGSMRSLPGSSSLPTASENGSRPLADDAG